MLGFSENLKRFEKRFSGPPLQINTQKILAEINFFVVIGQLFTKKNFYGGHPLHIWEIHFQERHK